jgi:hypothetical protein
MISADWSGYEYQPSFILGFHGCDASVGEKILRGEERHLRFSEKPFDWLGHGMYFWEGDPSRAMAWAEDKRRQGKIEKSFVLGAVVDLRRCLDLFNRDGLAQVKEAYNKLEISFGAAKNKARLPENVGPMPDMKGRLRDCAVINALHQYRDEQGKDPYDSVRGPFLEGDLLYAGAAMALSSVSVMSNALLLARWRAVAHGQPAIPPP